MPGWVNYEGIEKQILKIWENVDGNAKAITRATEEGGAILFRGEKGFLYVVTNNNQLWKYDVTDLTRTLGGFGFLGTFPSGASPATDFALDSNGDGILLTLDNVQAAHLANPGPSVGDVWRIDLNNLLNEMGDYGLIDVFPVERFPSGLGPRVIVPRGLVLESDRNALIIKTSTHFINEPQPIAAVDRIDLTDVDSSAGEYGRLFTIQVNGQVLPHKLALEVSGTFLICFWDQDLNRCRIRRRDLANVNESVDLGVGPVGLTGFRFELAVESSESVLVLGKASGENTLWRLNLTNLLDETGEFGLLGTLPGLEGRGVGMHLEI